MTDFAFFQVDSVEAAADHVISQVGDDPDALMALPIPYGISARERADLLHHLGAVGDELRARGYIVKTHVRRVPVGEVYLFDLVGRPDDDDLAGL